MIRHRLVYGLISFSLLALATSSIPSALALDATAGPGARAAQGATPSPLESLSGEYTNVADPDTPMSFYVRDGKLIAESERRVPKELKPIALTEFAVPDSKATISSLWTPRVTARALSSQTNPDVTYTRTGEPVHHTFHTYQRNEAMIPMRDGVKLYIVYMKPTDINGPLPFLIQRTPYSCEGTDNASWTSSRPELARDGYIYVCGDIRGKFKSEGEFIMSRRWLTRMTPKPWTRAPTPTTPWPGC